MRFLHSPSKDYSGLTIHHWDRGSGKDQFSRRKKHRQDIYDGIVSTIAKIPQDEKILIIHFKENAQTADIEKELRERFPSTERLRFCTWGKHTATNEFADCKHVILASVLQYSTPHYEAQTRGAKKIRTEDELSNSDHAKTRLGEVSHNIFQAACRGTVRKAEGGSCPAGCHLYIIYSARSLPRDLLPRIFPGAAIEKWQPVYNLNPRKQRLADYLLKRATREGTAVGKKELREYLGIAKTQLVEYLDSELIEYLGDVKSIRISVKDKWAKSFIITDMAGAYDLPF